MRSDLPEFPAEALGLTPEQTAPPPRNLAQASSHGSGGYAAAALDQECDEVARAANGSRNHTLNRAAFNLGQLVSAGELDDSTVRSRLLQAADSAGLIREDGKLATEKTIASGMKAGADHPRAAPVRATDMQRAYQGWQDRARSGQDRPRGAEDRQAPAAPTISTAADLRRKVFEPIRYVVPGYIAEGCTLLAGRPKLGKSWLVMDIGLAVATGSACLGGIECDQGDVLMLALEDNERRLQRRMDKVLGAFAEDWPAGLHYATEWPRANEGGLEAIERWINTVESPRLVVVDVLAMFKPVRGDKENLYEADYNAIKGLQALAGKYQVAIVVVHHTRKSGTESDPFEKVSGTLGLSGAADTTIILDRDGNGATLYGRGRDVEEIEAAVIFDKPSCRWSVLGEAGEVRRTDERGAILAALEDADDAMSPGELAIATGAARNATDQLLYKMSKAGEVVKVGRGRYVHPDRSDLIAANTATPHKNGKKIRSEAEALPPAGDGDDAPQSYDLTDLTGGSDLTGPQPPGSASTLGHEMREHFPHVFADTSRDPAEPDHEDTRSLKAKWHEGLRPDREQADA